MIESIKKQLLLLENETNQDFKLQQLEIIKVKIDKIIKDSIQDKKKYSEYVKVIKLIDFSIN